MVDIHHHQARQACCSLLAPGTCLAALRGGLVKRSLEDEGWQLAFQLGITRLAILVDVLVPLCRPDEGPKLGLVHRQRRIHKTLLITKHTNPFNP